MDPMDDVDEALGVADAPAVDSEQIGSDRRKLSCVPMLKLLRLIVRSLPCLKALEALRRVDGCGRKFVDPKRT
jgi:hypothetical protein